MIKQPLIERFGERLLTAVRERDMINIKKLIKFDIDINYHDNNGLSALVTSCITGFSWGCDILIDCGADVNIRMPVQMWTM